MKYNTQNNEIQQQKNEKKNIIKQQKTVYL